jgi:SAM-dependent methyltransferase
VRDRLRPYLVGTVMEVGAGKGSFTLALRACAEGPWWCLEPDADLARQIVDKDRQGAFPGGVHVVFGTEADVAPDVRVDAVLYLDVLEHIADDRAELSRAAARLAPGGRLIVLSPAFQMLFSPFDRVIGHYRRYTLTSLQQVRPPGFRTEAAFYMDAPGCLLSLANRLILRSEQPTLSQVQFWDNIIVPLARVVDPLVGRRFGRSVVVIWRND